MEHIQRALLDCLHCEGPNTGPEKLDARDEPAWEQTYQLAQRLGVAPLVYHRLRSREAGKMLPPAIWQAFKESYLGTAARNLESYQTLRHLASALKAADIPVLVLKGAFLTEVVYRNVGARPMVDIDVLVPLEHLDATAEILARQRYRAARPLDTDIVVQAVHHLPLCARPDTTSAIEVHWNITPPNLPYTIDAAELWGRSISTRIAGMGCAALCPADLLLHLCMHVAYMHEFACGLRPYCDIAAVIRHYETELDWNVLVERAVRWRWGRGVYLALRLARDMLGAGVPAWALSALEPAGFAPSLCEAARAQFFSDAAADPADVPSTPFAVLCERGGLKAKARILRLRLLPGSPTLARRYGVRPGSPAFYACYLRLWADLLVRYAPVSAKLLRGDAGLSQFVQSRQTLARWMSED